MRSDAISDIAGAAKGGESRTVHLITDFSAHAGAETMLARCIRYGAGGRDAVISLRSVSERNRALSGEDRATFEALGARGAVSLMRATAALAALLSRRGPARLVCWMYHAMVAGSLAARIAGRRTPVYWMVRQSLDDPASLSRSTRLAVAVAARLSPGATGVVYNSERARVLHHGAGFRADSEAVIPNGFELPPFEPPAPRAARVFGLAARVHPQKDHATFLAAAARVAARRPDVRFVLAGAGTDSVEVREMAARAGLPPERFAALGQLTDMAPFYRGVDALVLSSRTEGFPNVVGEAMSHGRPAIVTDVGDAAVIVGETGFVARPGDPDSLAEAILAMAALEPEAYAARAVAARTAIERGYAVEPVVRRIEAFIGAGGD